ncbi:MAG TPA: YbjN domain-containing protein [Alphaproteobacteria bacterium]|nr:YbjN domain-containing protein [Alphaproteobacteria bacterium]
MNDPQDMLDEALNPIDCVEEITTGHCWTVSRANDDELHVHVTGRRDTYELTFLWQEEYGTLQLYCEYDLTIPEDNFGPAAMALMAMNAGLWVGHFDLPGDTRTPCFRHTCLFRGPVGAVGQGRHIEDLIDIALTECDRYYMAFHLLSAPTCRDGDSLSLALMDIAGES